MAATKDWSAVATRCTTKYFAGGHATDWCVHTPPPSARAVVVRNRGTGVLYVSVPGVAGAAGATSDAARLQANEVQRFVFESRALAHTTFGTFGADGAAHVMDLTFEAIPG